MPSETVVQVQSESMTDFARVLASRGGTEVVSYPAGDRQMRIELDPEAVKNGLGQLVLTLVKLLHELLERQALRRVDAGSLTEEQIESVGLTLMRQAAEIERLRREFGLEEKDLNLNLGPLGRLF